MIRWGDDRFPTRKTYIMTDETTETAEVPEYTKTLHTLPREVYWAFKDLDNDGRDEYAKQLRAAGWTLESIAAAAGVTRERIRQIVGKGEADIIPVNQAKRPIPSPPLKPKPKRPEYVEPSPESLARLLELQEAASKVRGNGKRYRAEAEEYTALLYKVHKPISEGGEGVTLYRLAKRLGVTHGALRYRLVRYGYKEATSGTSKVYTRVKTENRVPVE